MDDRLVRLLTTWLMKSGWVRDYEHARAEAESFAAHYEQGQPLPAIALTAPRVTVNAIAGPATVPPRGVK